MTDKLFTVVGSSFYQGKTKLRFATDITRIKRLVRDGHSQINLIDLPVPMTKVEAAQYLNTVGFADSTEVQGAIDYVLKRDGKKLPEQLKAPAVENNDKSPITDQMEPALM